MGNSVEVAIPVMKGKGIVTLFMIVKGILFVGTIVNSLVGFTTHKIPVARNQDVKAATLIKKAADAAQGKIHVMKEKVIANLH